ncbi:MAG: FAD-dependent oxidoreductase, partial [Mycobacterium sp.]
MTKTVVVLGAGAGGLAAVGRLGTNLPSSDRIVLIDRSFTGSLGLSSLRVLRGWRTPEEVVTTVRPAALPGVSMVTGEVVGVDTDARAVQYRQDGSAAAVEYDALVLALGAGLDTAAIPGLNAALSRGVAGEFYTPDGAADLHRRIDTLESGRIVVLIVALPFKCPPAPYEAAFLIADHLGERFTGGAVRVDVITPEPRPIPVVDAQVGEAVVDMLGARGIGFHPGKTVSTINPATRTVEFTDGSTEPFDLLAVVPPHTSPAAAVLAGGVNPA